MVKTERSGFRFRMNWKQGLLMFLIIAGLFGGSHYYYTYQMADVIGVYKELITAISDSKVQEIQNWIDERKSEASYLSHSAGFISDFSNLAKDPSSEKNKQAVRNWIEPLKKNHEYTNIVLYNPEKKIIYSVDPGDPGNRELFNYASVLAGIRAGRVAMSEFLEDGRGKPFLVTSVALENQNRIAGYVLFFIDPSKNLFHTVAEVPVKCSSAENLLIHHLDGSAYYIAGNLNRPDTSVVFKSAVKDGSHKLIPSSGSFLLRESIDSRGTPVISAMRKISGTNWWLICKVDRTEVTAPLKKREISIILFIIGFVVIVMIIGSLLWKNQQLEYFRSQFRLQQKSQTDEEQIRYMNALLQEISDAIITFDKDMIIQSWNKGAERIYGWKAEEVVGKYAGGSLRVDFPGSGRVGILQELEHHGIWKGELVHKRKDGSTAYILSSTSQLKDEAGNVLGIITINKDITEVIHSEKVKGAVYRISELAHSSRDLNELLASVHIVIGDLMDAHNLYVALLEQDGETISFPYFVDEHDPAPSPRKRGNTLTDVVLRTGKHLLAKPEDVQYFIDRGLIEMKDTPAIDWLGVPLKTEKEVIGALVVQSYNPKIRYGDHEVDVLIFVSEQIALSVQRMKMQQELLVQKQKAEVSSKLASSLLANMNHELRTPMNGILGFAEILYNDLMDPEARTKAENILISGRRLMDTLDAIMDMSHLESDKVSRTFKPMAIKKSLVKAVSNYEHLIQRKNLALNVFVPPHLVVLADDYLLQHMFRCLIDNAIKYTDVGSITIEAREITEKEKAWIAISIRDTGIGIAEENFELIFETFRQVSEGYGRKFEGSGLGLAITRKIATLLNGEIRLKSTLGEGSEFTVILPASSIDSGSEPITEPEKKVTKKEPSFIPQNNISVLVVEDNLVNLQLLMLYIQDICTGYSALDGRAAIEMARGKVFDLILMDINLGPGLDGIQSMLEIRKLSEYKTVPIIALTGYASIGDRDRLISLGFSGYLPKPVTKEILLGLIDETVRPAASA